MAMQYAMVSSNQNATTSMNYSNAAWNGNIFAAFKAGSSTAGGPAVTLTPSSVNFGNVPRGGDTPPQKVTITNSGSSALTIKKFDANSKGFDNPPFFVSSTNCPLSPATLAAGASCTVSVTFDSVGNPGETITGKLQVYDDASNSPQTA